MDLNEQIKKIAEVTRQSNNLLERLGILKELENKLEVIFDKDITKIGSGSHIILPGKFEGHKASLIIKNKKPENEK